MIKKYLQIFGEKFLAVQTLAILSLVYFIILGPIAVFARISKKDFLNLNNKKNSFWQKKKKFVASVEELRRPY